MGKTLSTFLTGLLGAAVFFGIWSFFMPATFTETQKSEIEKISSNYFISNPDVLSKAYENLMEKKRKQEGEQAFKSIVSNIEDLTNSQNFELGNPNGDIVMVEFQDYQCPHCKKMEPAVNELIKKNPTLRVVIKQLPIFGENSKYAALAAMAAEKQGKFAEFHNALLAENEPLKQEKVLEIAKANGINIDKLKEDMKQESFDKSIQDAYRLATQIPVRGTPFFILLKTPQNGRDIHPNDIKVIPGEVSENQLQQSIDTLQQ